MGNNQIGAIFLVAVTWPVWKFNLWMLFAHENVYVWNPKGFGTVAQRVSRKENPVSFWASACLGIAILVGVTGLAAFVFFLR